MKRRWMFAKRLLAVILVLFLTFSSDSAVLTGISSGEAYAASSLDSWRSYGSTYFYKKMTRAERTFYKKLLTTCQKYLTSSGLDAKKVRAYIKQSDGSERYQTTYATEAVAATGLTYSAATRVITVFTYNNPQYYFLDNGYLYSTSYDSGENEYSLTFFNAFAKGTTRAKATVKMAKVVNKWLKKINAQSGYVKKLQVAQDLVCKKVKYGKSTYDQSAYSVFCGKRTVCAGYSSAFSLLCQAAGITCINVTSDVQKDGTDYSHQWNLVKVNGHWYNIDVCWDDLNGQNYAGNTVSYYEYFLRDDRHFIYDYNYQSHQDMTSYFSHYPEMEYSHYGIPKATHDSNPDYPFVNPGSI